MEGIKWTREARRDQSTEEEVRKTRTAEGRKPGPEEKGSQVHCGSTVVFAFGHQDGITTVQCFLKAGPARRLLRRGASSDCCGGLW